MSPVSVQLLTMAVMNPQTAVMAPCRGHYKSDPSLPLTGCAVGVGYALSGEVMTTKGEELTDLERARKAGLVTPTKFADQRRKILER